MTTEMDILSVPSIDITNISSLDLDETRSANEPPPYALLKKESSSDFCSDLNEILRSTLELKYPHLTSEQIDELVRSVNNEVSRLFKITSAMLLSYPISQPS